MRRRVLTRSGRCTCEEPLTDVSRRDATGPVDHPETGARQRAVAAALALLLAVALSSGCDASVRRAKIDEAPCPEGGAVLTLAALPNSDGGTMLLAPTEHALFVRQDEVWQARVPPHTAHNPSLSAFSSLATQGRQFNYPRERLFTSFAGRVWVLDQQDAGVQLLSGPDAGGGWTTVELPTSFVERHRPRVEAPTERSMAVARAVEPGRLYAAKQALYLIDSSEIWRRGPKSNTWESVGLLGLPLEQTDPKQLPPAIRNYLPAQAGRDFELLTLLADQLRVYRRTQANEPWVLTSTLATVDREVIGVPGSDALWLVAPDALFRSDDQGEQWVRLWPEGQPGPEVAAIVAAGPDRPHAVVVGASDGSIWRSTTAGGAWERTWPADLDRRSVTAFLSTAPGTVWASSMGRGVMWSSDAGKTWSMQNRGLRATAPVDVALTQAGDPVLATRTGLYQLTGEASSGTWTLLHDRASSAVTVDPNSGKIVTGTLSGDLLVQNEHKALVETTSPFADAPSFLFAPPHLALAELSPRSVVAVEPRDDGQNWLAWSRRQGAARSVDGGENWAPHPISEALTAALRASAVTQLIVDPQETTYLLEESPTRDSPALLWRSTDDGESWTSVNAFPSHQGARLMVKPRPPNYPGYLVAAQGDQVWTSRDAGESWTELDGPWRSRQVVDFAVRDQRAVFLVDTRRQYEVVVVDGLDSAAPTMTRHLLDFPQGVVLPAPNDVAALEFHDRRIVIADRHRIFTGTLPQGKDTLPAGTAMAAAVGASLLLIGAAFVVLKLGLRR